MLSLNVRTRFDAQTLRRKVNDATFRSLGHAGGAIRLTARRSIRRNKKPSSPGMPPHTPTGMLKRVIRYEVNSSKDNVVIGPVNEIAGRLWNLHEFGGIKKRKPLKPHQFRVGEFGPIRQIHSTKFARIKLKTAAQANRASLLIANENRTRAALTLRYPKRPFMGPALEANRARLPQFWKNSVHS